MGLNQIDEALSRALEHGPVSAAEVKALLLAMGYSTKQVRASRERLGVAVERTGFGSTTRTIWSLPALVPIADAFVPLSDAFVPSLPAFAPFTDIEELRKLHAAEVERLSLALAAAHAEAAALRQMIALRDQALKIVAPAEPEPPVEISRLDRVLLGAMPSGWCSVLKITCQRIEGLSSGPTVHRRLGRLAEAGLVESRPGGRQTRHGTAVQVYRRAPAAAVCLMGN